MPDYHQLRELCKQKSEVSEVVIDKFLLYYAAKRDKLDKEFDAKISRFRHAGNGMPPSWIGLLKAQYIGHRIFRKGGPIVKYLNHAAIKDLSAEEQDFLQQMAAHPWLFSFSEITANPADDFYEMEDIFTGETYILYSTAVRQILLERPVLLWFNLIGFNGGCWQTYGPVTGFQCFDGDDIFFYSTELDGSIQTETDLLKNLDNNPVPYMMLATGSAYPIIQNAGFEIVHVLGENDFALFDMQTLTKKFTIAYTEGIFKITDTTWSAFPHFSEAYYEEDRGIMFLSAFTDRGYLEMVKKLNAQGCNLPVEPDIRLHPPILTVIKQLLKKELELNPYSRLFETATSPENNAILEKLNEFLLRALPYINAGKEPDIDALAKETGVDPRAARDLLQKSMNRIKELRK